LDNASGAVSVRRVIAIATAIIMVIAIGIVFVLGLATTVFLSLRSPEVKVPDVVGKERSEAERVLGEAGLNFRVRKAVPRNQVKADTVLFQLPGGGEVVKVGQTIAMDVSRTPKEGEASEAAAPEKSPEEKPTNANETTSANENKPKRPRSSNKNDNENANGNSLNRNGNINRAATNRNANNGNTNRALNANSNRPAINLNANRSVNQNGNSRPPARPSPAIRPN